MGKVIAILLWIVISILLCLFFGKNIYKRCHYHLSFQLQWDVDETKDNSRQKLSIRIKNKSIHKILIQEVGLYHKDTQQFYSFHKLIDGSSPLPTWVNSEQEIQFVQYIVDIDPKFRKNIKNIRPYAKDSQGRTYF